MLTLPKYANMLSTLQFTPFMNVEKATIQAHKADNEQKKSTFSTIVYSKGYAVKYLEMKNKKKRTMHIVYTFLSFTNLSTTECLRIKQPKQNGMKYFNKFTYI